MIRSPLCFAFCLAVLLATAVVANRRINSYAQDVLTTTLGHVPPVLTLNAPTKTFTEAEWEELTKDDEVLKFVDRVNAAALAKDYWKTDFRRAQYDAFNEVCSKHVLDKYNQGQPIKWK